VLRGHRYYSNVQNVHALAEDKSVDSKDSFRAELEQVSFTSHTNPVRCQRKLMEQKSKRGFKLNGIHQLSGYTYCTRSCYVLYTVCPDSLSVVGENS
jgi:hypothetical protein